MRMRPCVNPGLWKASHFARKNTPIRWLINLTNYEDITAMPQAVSETSMAVLVMKPAVWSTPFVKALVSSFFCETLKTVPNRGVLCD